MAARPVAVLLAGQARTLREPQVRQELLRNVVRPTSAALFAHISPQHDYAPWHNYSFVADAGDPEDDLATALHREFDPLPYLRVEPDEQVIRRRQQSNGGSNRWYGAIPWLERPSVLFFRWVLLLEALEVDERRRANRYGVVLRLRPDLVLTCQLPADPLTMLGGYDVVQHGDLALFMRREAASIALSMYQQAARVAAMCAQGGAVRAWAACPAQLFRWHDGAWHRRARAAGGLLQPIRGAVEGARVARVRAEVPRAAEAALPRRAASLEPLGARALLEGKEDKAF